MNEKIVVEREFGISRDDFLRIFPRLAPTYNQLNEDEFLLETEELGRLLIRLSEQHYRQLGALKIPYLDLVFEFEGSTEQQRAEFFGKFERYFQKGGG